MTEKRSGLSLGKVVGVVAIVVIVFLLFKTGAIEYLKDRRKMEAFIEGFGIWGPLVYIVAYILVTITGISAVPMTIAGGLIFGALFGVIYTVIGAGIGLSLAFLIARYIARGFIEKKFGNTEAFKRIDEGVRSQGWFILATTRLIPIFPFGIQNYVYGLTSIGFLQYSILSTIFIIPGTSVYVILAGAVASGDTAKATRLAIIASLIFFAITVVIKLVARKGRKSQ